jgi:hypothetical protein
MRTWVKWGIIKKLIFLDLNDIIGLAICSTESDCHNSIISFLIETSD